VRRRIFGLPESPISLFPHPQRENRARDGDHKGRSTGLSSQNGHDDEDGGENEEETAER
jgi:hypothetical protein